MQETLRDASEQHSRNASVTSGSDDDHVGIGLLGEIRDEIRGIGVEAVYDVEGCADARLDEGAPPERPPRRSSACTTRSLPSV